MTEGWDWAEAAEGLTAHLEGAGFDVDRRDTAEGGGSLTARRDRGAQTELVAVDALGRVRLTVTLAEEEATLPPYVVGWVRLRGVATVTRRFDLAARLTSPDQLGAVLAALPGIVHQATEASHRAAQGTGREW